MSNRDKSSILFLALGLSLSGVGVATGSHFLTFAGVFTIAVTVRYRKRPPVWDYLAFLVLILVIVALVSQNSPLISALPLMLSYVFDYIDEQRQKRIRIPGSDGHHPFRTTRRTEWLSRSANGKCGCC